VLKLGENVAYLTTGDFLGIPPIELMTTDLGYGGMQYELANINTEFGYFWVDQKRGQIHRLSNSLDTISNKGLSMWMKENISNNVELGYDPYFQRIIFAHKDNDKTECNKAWTLAFYPYYDAFISFYSYSPDRLFASHNTYYTTKNNKIYKHLRGGSYLNFYGEDAPFIIEEVQNDFSTDNLGSVFYFTEFYNDDNGQLNQITDAYDNLIVYNNKQSTGKLDLVRIDQVTNPYGNINLSPNQKSVIITDENSKISGLYDLSTSTQVTTKYCNGDEYSDVAFINTDTTKSQYEYAPFKDKHVRVRLFYYPNNNVKLIHYLTQINENKSIR